VARSPENLAGPPQTLSLSVNPEVALVNSWREKNPSDPRRSPASGSAADGPRPWGCLSCAGNGGKRIFGGKGSIVTC